MMKRVWERHLGQLGTLVANQLSRFAAASGSGAAAVKSARSNSLRHGSRWNGAESIEALESRALLAVVPTGFTETEIASQLSSPTAMQIAPDGRIFVGQQNGVIRLINDAGLVPTPVGNVNADGSGERGLQGMAIDPNFAQNGYLYIYYTRAVPASHNVVSRITIVGDQMLPGSEQILFEMPNLSTVGNPIWHMGGSIEVTADGYIFFAVGDHQQSNLAQQMNSPFGKLMRIRTDGSIPTDNPFYNTTTGIQRAIWGLGLRNPFTGAVQPETGRYFLDDVGAGSWEEVNEASRGANFGWPTTEGFFNQASFPNFTNPVHAYSHANGCAITGGTFYPQNSIQYPEQYEGKYFFSEFCSGQIRVIDPNNGAASTVFVSGINFPMGIETGPDGSLFYIERGAGAGGADGTNRGSIHKVAYVDRVAPFVAQHPRNLLVSVGQTAEFSVSASGTNPLTYQWQRAEVGGEFVDIPGATTSALQLANAALSDSADRFRVIVTNNIGVATSNEAVLTVTTDTPPTASITLPTGLLKYNAGDTLHFEGLGTDVEDGALAATQLTWQIDFHHHEHSHPFYPPTSGVSMGDVVIPTTGETDPDVFYRVSLKATDSIGLTNSTFVDVHPNLGHISLNSNIPSVKINLDGQPKTVPFEVDGVVNILRTVEAPSFVQSGGQAFEFDRWENGETQRQVTFATSAVSNTWNALYKVTNVTFVSDLPYALEPTNGWGPPERDRSNGETGATDGNPITLQGVLFEKGLGVHANGQVAFDLGGAYSRFRSTIGLDDETGSGGSVIFRVMADGALLYESPVMLGDSANIEVDVSVANRNRLVLEVLDAGDGNGLDHADWAFARLTSAIVNNTPPTAPADFTAQGISRVVRLAWDDRSNNELGFRIERRFLGGAWTFAGNALANTESYVDSGLFPDVVYEYRITAFNTIGDSDSLQSQAVTRGGIHVNFQPAGSEPAYDYLVDSGAAFAEHGNLQYGWNIDTSVATRERNSSLAPDQRYDTLIHMQKPENPNAVWEIAVPNGRYSVHVAGGDPTFYDGLMSTAVEGVVAYEQGLSTANPFVEATVVVEVTDGRLTLTSGPNAVNNKIVFVNIHSALTAEIRQSGRVADAPSYESLDVVFNRPVTGFDLTDLRLVKSGDSTNILEGSDITVTSVNQSTFQLSRLGPIVKGPADYVLSLAPDGSDIEDFFGDSLQDDSSFSFHVISPLRSLGDIDDDGLIGIKDFAILRSMFNQTVNLHPADLNNNGKVAIEDFAILRRNFNRRV